MTPTSCQVSLQASYMTPTSCQVLASITHDAKITSIILAASDMTPASYHVVLQHQTRRQHYVKYPCSIRHDANITSNILASSNMTPTSCQVSLRASDMTPTSCQVSLQHQTRRQHHVKYPCFIKHDANIVSSILASIRHDANIVSSILAASDMTPTSGLVSLQRFSRNNDSLSSEQLNAMDLLTICSHLSISDTITDRAELMEDCGFETYRISSS